MPHWWCQSNQLFTANNHSAVLFISYLAAANFGSVLYNVGAWAGSLHHVFRQAGGAGGMNHSEDTLESLVGQCVKLNTGEVARHYTYSWHSNIRGQPVQLLFIRSPKQYCS